MTDDPLAAHLTSILGAEHVLTDPDLLATYETDWTRRYHGTARVVARPADTSQVASTLAALHAENVAVVPQGGNTGLVGGSVPRGGEAVLSLRRLTTITAFDPIAQEVTVDAGVTLRALQDFAGSHNLRFGVDIASRDSATIGGMVATNAGGIRVMRFGPMRSQLVGIEAVLADGTVITRLPGLAKDNTGYDLPGLFAGSEGTLGVITRVRLRLHAEAGARATALLAVPDAEAALAIVAHIRTRLASLEAAEIFYARGIDLVCQHAGLPLPFAGRYPAYLLLECAAASDPLEALGTALDGAEAILASAVARDRADRDRLWAYRERHTEAINAEGVPHKLDVALPLVNLTAFAEAAPPVVEQAAPGARVFLFGHVADGNLHVNVLGLEPDDDRATDAILRLAASLGGSISAEHGIGIAKTRWLTLTRTPGDIRTMRAIKSALDPGGILNPGVIFER